jgi:hypothetical protein
MTSATADPAFSGAPAETVDLGAARPVRQIKTPTGARHTWRRKPAEPGCVVAWELAAGSRARSRASPRGLGEAHAVVADAPGEPTRLTIYGAGGTIAAVSLDPLRAVRLATRLIAAASARLSG